MLYIFGGLPGMGKTTLATALARRRHAVFLRIDTIEQALRKPATTDIGPEGYQVAYKIALDNLRLGLAVVADSVNPLAITRAAWRETAVLAESPWVEIEVVCSDQAAHRTRIATRTSDIPGLKLPDWEAVTRRQYEPWDSEHLVIDTAHRTVEQSIHDLLIRLNALTSGLTNQR